MRKILSSLACLALCLFVWAGMAGAAAPRVLVLPFAINAPEASAQLASDVPALLAALFQGEVFQHSLLLRLSFALQVVEVLLFCENIHPLLLPNLSIRQAK